MRASASLRKESVMPRRLVRSPPDPLAHPRCAGAPQASPQTAKRKLQLGLSSTKEMDSVTSEEGPLNHHALTWS